MNRDPDPRTGDGPRATSPQPGIRSAAGGETSPVTDDADTGLPGLHSWRGVYRVVLGLLLVWVGLLTWLSLHYS